MTTLYQIREENTTEKVSTEFGNLLTSTSNGRYSVSENPQIVDNLVSIGDNRYEFGKKSTAVSEEGKEVGYYEMNELYQYYCDTLNRQHVPPVVRRQMIEYIENGITPELIMIALDASADAPNPTWRYAVAVLERCKRQGIKDKKAYFDAQNRFYGTKSIKNGGFSQRNYKKEDLNKGFFVDPFECKKA